MLKLILTTSSSQPPDFMLVAQNMRTYQLCGYTEQDGNNEISDIPDGFMQMVLPGEHGDYLTLAEIAEIKGHPESDEFVPQRARLRQAEYARMIREENKEDGEVLIDWDGEALTVDAANQKWSEYAAEGSEKAEELQSLIVAAKAYIRGMYPS